MKHDRAARALVVGAFMLMVEAGTAAAAQSLMPSGVGVHATLAGLVFTDERGMTLYRKIEADKPCTDQPDLVRKDLGDTLSGLAVGFSFKIPEPQSRRSCADKYPPFLAPGNAAPVGEWSLVQRGQDAAQWAYEHAPLHTSRKDARPGDVNASYVHWLGDGNAQGDRNDDKPFGVWSPAFAPPEVFGIPAGISVRRTVLGLALTTHEGSTLYFAEPGAAFDDWRPLTAPAMASAGLHRDWSIVIHEGRRQWAWRGKPLFYYAHDTADVLLNSGQSLFAEVYGGTYGRPIPAWRVALLYVAPAPPAGITVTALNGGGYNPGIEHFIVRNYADADGRALYMMRCHEEMTEDQLDCDDVGDAPQYWLSFCGGESRCLQTWRPLRAPPGAEPRGNVWSVITLNPHHPFKPLSQEEPGLSVWAYRGRPVFTYAQDFRRGDYNGAIGDRAFSTLMRSHPLPAYGTR